MRKPAFLLMEPPPLRASSLVGMGDDESLPAAAAAAMPTALELAGDLSGCRLPVLALAAKADAMGGVPAWLDDGEPTTLGTAEAEADIVGVAPDVPVVLDAVVIVASCCAAAVAEAAEVPAISISAV
jgi:hypothetical protein